MICNKMISEKYQMNSVNDHHTNSELNSKILNLNKELLKKNMLLKSQETQILQLRTSLDELLMSNIVSNIVLNPESESENLQEIALREIFRKEEVISHKDNKATKLIKIIREKNIKIKNLERRVGKCNSVNTNRNWRIRD